MYLAPLNYDRYFKKVFSDLDIAKRFLEDFFDITIQEIEKLEIKKSITDDARSVEFDFRCKIDDRFVIIEMQQWYKPDVIQRFYVYHALNTALQLEKLPNKNVLASEKQLTKVKDYLQIMPVITLVWLVDDNLGFTEDYIGFVPTPEQVTTFIKDVKLWQNPDIQELISQRNLLLKQLENKSKDLPWLYENRLIYAFQKNIVKNKKYEKYYAWFELAQKTLDKISDKFAYSEYEKDAVLNEIMRRLSKEIDDPMQMEYIEDYDRFRIEIERYEEGVRATALREGMSKGLKEGRKEGIQEAEAELLPQLQAERQKLIETAKFLKTLNIDSQTISLKTGLSIEEIENLAIK